MSLEFNYKNAVRFALAATLLTNATATYVQRPETGRAFSALGGLNPNCQEIIPSLRHYDMIAVFGAGTYIDENDINQPNSFQTERLKMAAVAVVAGFSDKILLVDGGDGSVENASIILLENYIYEISFGQNTLNRDKVKSIQNSLNSAENVRDLGLYMKTNGLTKVLSITDLFHYNRLKLLVENYDITTDIAPTECLAIEYMPGDLPYLVERSYSPEMLKMVLKEKIAILELAIDKKGILPIAIKTFLNELNVSREK